MSGGSLGYAYAKVEDIADAVASEASPDKPVLYSLAVHLKRVASVLHEVEWALSHDTDWTESECERKIRELLSPGDQLTEVTNLMSLVSDAAEALIKIGQRLQGGVR